MVNVQEYKISQQIYIKAYIKSLMEAKAHINDQFNDIMNKCGCIGHLFISTTDKKEICTICGKIINCNKDDEHI